MTHVFMEPGAKPAVVITSWPSERWEAHRVLMCQNWRDAFGGRVFVFDTESAAAEFAAIWE